MESCYPATDDCVRYGNVEGMEPNAEIGYKMKIIFVSMQAVGLVVAILLMALFPIGRKRAEETRRILDERKQAEAVEGSV